MDWALLALVALTIAAFLVLYPKLDNKVNVELKYPGLIANLPYILDGVDFLIAMYYPTVPYRILIQVVKQLIADYTPDKLISEAEFNKLVNYVLTTKFSAQVMLAKDVESIPTTVKNRVESEVKRLLQEF